MALSAFVALTVELGWPVDRQTVSILAVYFSGGLIGCLLAWPFIVFVGNRVSMPVATVFAAFMLTGLTLGATAGVLALDYRAYYAQWHDDILSKIWLYQQFYTALGSTYQFAVIGIRLYWPIGVLCIIPASLWLARRTS